MASNNDCLCLDLFLRALHRFCIENVLQNISGGPGASPLWEHPSLHAVELQSFAKRSFKQQVKLIVREALNPRTLIFEKNAPQSKCAEKTNRGCEGRVKSSAWLLGSISWAYVPLLFLFIITFYDFHVYRMMC